jgi:hypothetical protein
VEALCEIKQEELPQTLGDPFLDWVFLSATPTPPPPEIEDISRFLDSFFSAPISQVSIYWYEEPQQAPHFMIDTAAAKLAAEKEPEEIPALAYQLQNYGEKMMQMHEEDSLHHLMGRRLTEMDATTIQHHVRLPFGCPKNRCLRDAMVQNKVSDECARSMHQLETTYELEEELELRQEDFVGMVGLYLCIMYPFGSLGTQVPLWSSRAPSPYENSSSSLLQPNSQAPNRKRTWRVCRKCPTPSVPCLDGHEYGQQRLEAPLALHEADPHGPLYGPLFYYLDSCLRGSLLGLAHLHFLVHAAHRPNLLVSRPSERM